MHLVHKLKQVQGNITQRINLQERKAMGWKSASPLDFFSQRRQTILHFEQCSNLFAEGAVHSKLRDSGFRFVDLAGKLGKSPDDCI
jgi:hypothetical protein